MISLSPFLCIFLYLTSVSSREQTLVEYLQQHGTCEDSFLVLKTDELTNCRQTIKSNVVSKLSSGTSQRDSIRNFCKSNLAECAAKTAEGVKDCLDKDTYEVVFKNPAKVISSMQEYACSDKGKPLQDFLTDGISCLANRTVVDNLATCKVNFDEQIAAQPTEVLFSSDTSVTCRIARENIKCTGEALDACEDKTAKNFMENFMMSGIKVYCNEVVKRDLRNFYMFNVL